MNIIERAQFTLANPSLAQPPETENELAQALLDAVEVIQELDDYLTRHDGVANYIASHCILHKKARATLRRLKGET